jgi:hypothetical protein
MTELVVDAVTGQKMRQLSDWTVVKDETGRALGRFVPEVDPSEYLHPDAQIGPTDEEVARAWSPDAKVYTTAEVLAYLRSLK